MKSTMVIIGLMLVLSACTQQVEINNFEECVKAGNPVMESYPRQCSADGEIFVEELPLPSEATLCADPRPTAATKEYVPVTGSDGEEYPNWRTACMNEAVQWYIPSMTDNQPEENNLQAHQCSEEEKQAQICTLEYAPVCGLVDNGIRCVTTPCPSLDAKTFSNGCSACAAQAQEYYQGACEDQTFVVCNGEAKTRFDPEEHAKNIGGICVETCPGNYDAFTTQIGVQLCIQHYGVEEIDSWDVCEASSESCECVKARETTQNEEISDAKYRCVPEMYAQRMLFRSGLDRLDEKGDQSVMIA